MRRGAYVAGRLRNVANPCKSRPAALTVTIALCILVVALILEAMFAMTYVFTDLIGSVQGILVDSMFGAHTVFNSAKGAALIQVGIILLVPMIRFGQIGTLEQAARLSKEVFLFALVCVVIKSAAVLVMKSTALM